MPPPLSKIDKNGAPYVRRAAVESLIIEVSALGRDAIIERCSISDRHATGYLPSEVVLHFLRTTGKDNRKSFFGKLFRCLFARVEAGLRAAIRDSQYRNADEIRDEVSGRFAELIARDRAENSDRLDIYEVSFDAAIASMRIDVLRQLGPQRLKAEPIELDETGEPSQAVEQAAQKQLGHAREKLDDPTCRLAFLAAIDALPDNEKTVIGLLLQGLPIDSKEPDAVTIAGTLGCSEKTVRNRRDRAFAKLKTALGEEYDS